VTLAVSGYVLAGGKSSRMGEDKALLKLGGQTLVELAVATLKAVCLDVHILSSRDDLAIYGALQPDEHPGCGPLGGIEAGLLHARCAWSLFLPVDMPLVTVEFLGKWIDQVSTLPDARIALFTVGDIPQPTLCLLHREVRPFVEEALAGGRFKLNPVLKQAAEAIAADKGHSVNSVFLNQKVSDEAMFANANTPEEFTATTLLYEASAIRDAGAS